MAARRCTTGKPTRRDLEQAAVAAKIELGRRLLVASISEPAKAAEADNHHRPGQDRGYGFAIGFAAAYIPLMPRRPLELPPGVARAFVEDMRAFFAESDLTKRDEIAARQLHALRPHYAGRLRLYDVIEMFLRMKNVM
jgi:hypothetical protein